MQGTYAFRKSIGLHPTAEEEVGEAPPSGPPATEIISEPRRATCSGIEKKIKYSHLGPTHETAESGQSRKRRGGIDKPEGFWGQPKSRGWPVEDALACVPPPRPGPLTRSGNQPTSSSMPCKSIDRIDARERFR